MNKLHVEDITCDDVKHSEYDLGIFSMGYEDRCIEIPSNLLGSNVSYSIILGFDEHHEDPARNLCKIFFKENWPKSVLLNINKDEIKSIITTIGNFFKTTDKEHISILIDYTSMSRVWYAAILNYLIRFSEKKITVDLTYASGLYENTNLNVELGSLKVIPGCEGVTLTKNKSAAIFMLGFDTNGPLRLYDLLNPNKCFGIMASPASSEAYVAKCKEKNEILISHHLDNGKNLIELPLNSLSVCYEHMSQILAPLTKNYNVTIIPFGPKPHILASILCGLNFKNISCMYSEYIRRTTTKVTASGDYVLSRLFVNNNI
jgi:hypothetical protein